MNIVSPLIPVAVAALETVVSGVGEVLQNGKSFARLMHASPTEQVEAGGARSVAAADAAPKQSELGQQVQRAALRQRFETQRQLLHQQLMQRFAEQGIDLSESPVLTVDASGHLLEASGHWDRAQIEELLRSDAGLQNDLVQLLQQGSALRQSGPQAAGGGTSEVARLVVSEKEIFFQVV